MSLMICNPQIESGHIEAGSPEFGTLSEKVGMPRNMKKASLTPARQRLVELMQEINHGQVLGLRVRDGEPIFVPPPQVIRDMKLGSQNGPRPEANLDDFALKTEVVDLFSQFDLFDDVTLLSLDVKYGLPFRIRLEVAPPK